MNQSVRGRSKYILGLLLLVWHINATAQAAGSSRVPTSQPSHLRLIDPLDRQDDGYCIDVHGTPGYLRTDLPLFAHNCKQGLTVDSAVLLDADGRIRFVELDLCVTVAGVNSQALPGASILVRKCDEATPFFEVTQLQRFALREDGQLSLKQSELCLAVGNRSATTYSSADQWRTLFVDDCRTVELARSRWGLSFLHAELLCSYEYLPGSATQDGMLALGNQSGNLLYFSVAEELQKVFNQTIGSSI